VLGMIAVLIRVFFHLLKNPLYQRGMIEEQGQSAFYLIKAEILGHQHIMCGEDVSWVGRSMIDVHIDVFIEFVLLLFGFAAKHFIKVL